MRQGIRKKTDVRCRKLENADEEGRRILHDTRELRQWRNCEEERRKKTRVQITKKTPAPSPTDNYDDFEPEIAGRCRMGWGVMQHNEKTK